MHVYRVAVLLSSPGYETASDGLWTSASATSTVATTAGSNLPLWPQQQQSEPQYMRYDRNFEAMNTNKTNNTGIAFI
jgi:hypothetical protein